MKEQYSSETSKPMSQKNHEAKKVDFKIRYRFFNKQEGGRVLSPNQGYRCDFSYEGDDIQKTGVFMIWPEFEDESGHLVRPERPVLAKGIARMRIVNPAQRGYHQKRIKVGVIGYLMEGSRKVAECEVTEVIDLLANPAI